ARHRCAPRPAVSRGGVLRTPAPAGTLLAAWGRTGTDVERHLTEHVAAVAAGGCNGDALAFVSVFLRAGQAALVCAGRPAAGGPRDGRGASTPPRTRFGTRSGWPRAGSRHTGRTAARRWRPA